MFSDVGESLGQEREWEKRQWERQWEKGKERERERCISSIYMCNNNKQDEILARNLYDTKITK